MISMAWLAPSGARKFQIQPRWMVIAFGSQFVELADHRLFDEPTPAQDVAPVQPDIHVTEKHRSAVAFATRIAGRPALSTKEICIEGKVKPALMPALRQGVDYHRLAEIHHHVRRRAGWRRRHVAGSLAAR
jgi:hypothetical protein